MKLPILAAFLLSSAGMAQIPGSGEGAGAMIGAGINQQVPGTAIGQTLGGINGQVRAIDDGARESARDASDRAARAGDGRVDRRARCRDAAGEFPPRRRDGHHYCERDPGAQVKAVDR